MPTTDTDVTVTGPIALTCDAGFIEIQAAEAGSDAQLLPRFSMLAYSGESMRVDGWQHPIVVDLAGLSIPSQRRPIRFSHNAFQGIGHTERIVVENGRLIAEGVVSRDTPAAREIVVSGKRGFPWQASIGAQVAKAEFIKAGRVVEANGRTFRGPLYIARQTVLGEISFVDLGADGNTSATIAAIQETHGMSTEAQQAATDVTDTTDSSPPPPAQASAPAPETGQAAQGAPGGALQAGANVAQGQPDPVAQIRAQAAAESKRIADIRRICAPASGSNLPGSNLPGNNLPGGNLPGVETKAIAEGWDCTRTELEVLRASRPKVPSVPGFIASGAGVNNQVLEAACMLAAGLTDTSTLYDEQTLDNAQKRFRGSIGLQELLLEAAWANGYTGRNFRDSRQVLRFAFAHNVEASGGFSNIDVGGILSNVANKFLLEGFFSVERVWRNICAIRNVNDFKTVTSYRLIGKDQYEQVAPGGELKHGTLGEERYRNKADTYGLLLAIDRRDIINDDLGAITTVPRKLGRGSGLKINDVFWATFLDNAAFFTAGNSNYVDGADSALSIDGLTKAEVTFLDQVDGDDKPIGIMPAIVLVPTSLSATGTQLYKSVEMRDTTSNVKYPIANPHQGKFRVEVSRYLANAHYTPGSSAKAWYLLADPNDLPVIEVAFVNGQESPTIETAEADFNYLGVQMRGYHDFGVALQDPRGGVRMKGEA